MPNDMTPWAAVVNDDPTQLHVLCGLVRKAGLDPHGFTGAEGALAALSAGTGTASAPGAMPALVVTDLYMPGIDGFRFCRLLRSPEYVACNQVPILVVSATYAGDETDRVAAELGADAFLPAPVDGPRFIEQVRKTLAGTRGRIRLRALIVEDSTTLADILKRAFISHGYDADTALTARVATDAFATTAYDLAVLDYHLPDGTGDILLDAFRAAQPGCVCIMMTADTGPALALDWMKRGAAAYVRKPFDPDYLIGLCEHVRRERALLRVQDVLEVRTRELRESEERLSNAVEMARLGHWEYDVASDLFTFNDHFYKIFRTSAGQVGGYTMSSAEYARRFVYPDDRAVVGEETRKAIETTDPDFSRNLEHRMIFADGTVGHVNVRFFITKDAHGRTVKTYGVNQDITERKQAEDELRDANWRMQSILEGTNVGTWEVNVQTGEVVFNKVWAEILGYTLAELAPVSIKTLEALAYADDVAQYTEMLERHFSGALPYYSYEYRMTHKDGRCVWVHDRGRLVTRTGDGKPLMMFGTHTDITERKLTEEALRESDAHYRSLVEGAPGIVYAYSNIRGGVFYSSRAADLLGYSPEQLLANPQLWKEAIHPDDLLLVQRSVAGAMDGTPFAIEYRIRDAHGDWRWFDDRSTQFNTTGAETVIEGFALDITERKQAEAEKAKLEGQLQQAQKMESVGRLAGGVAHDFNNMLGVILGQTELALERVDATQPLHADLEEIRKAATRSADLTRQLLAFARKQTIAPKVLHLNETIADMLKMLQRLIGEDVRLAWLPGHGLWPVNVDPSQIDQILANLCVNARDAIAGVGKLTIETTNTTFDEAYCGTHAGSVPGDYVRLTVSDDGCGMDTETVSHLFEPFFTTKDVGKGTGLGLPTVYGIVKQNHGFIDVSSEPGHGTTFTISLPRHVGKTEQTRMDAPAEPAKRGHETILLVEDEPAFLTLTTKMLERQGYTVLAAQTPGEAIRLAREYFGEIHLVLTDVVMPEINGWDLARNLLSLYPHLGRLLMSGYSSDVIAHFGVLDDGVFFIQKPFSIRDLAAKVREAMDRA